MSELNNKILIIFTFVGLLITFFTSIKYVHSYQLNKIMINNNLKIKLRNEYIELQEEKIIKLSYQLKKDMINNSETKK